MSSLFGDLGPILSQRLAKLGQALFDDAPAEDRPQSMLGGAEFSAWLAPRYYDPIHRLYIQGRQRPGKPGPATETGLGFVIEVAPMLGGSDNQQRILNELFNEAIPDNARCQVIQYASPKVAGQLDRWADERSRRGGVFAEIAKHRRERYRGATWRSMSQRGEFLIRHIRVFLCVEIDGQTSEPFMKKLAEVREKCITSFASLGCMAVDMAPEDLIALHHDILNPTTSIEPSRGHYDPKLEINRQCVRYDTRVAVHPNRLTLRTHAVPDEYGSADWRKESIARPEMFEFRALACRQFPDHSNQNAMAQTIGSLFNDQLRLASPTLACFAFSTSTYEKTRAETEMKSLRTAQYQDKGMTRLFPGMRKSADDWAMVGEDVADGARLAQCGFFVVAMAKYGEGDQVESLLRAIYRNARFSLERHDFKQLPTLMACLPLGFGGGMDEDFKAMKRLRRMPTTAVAKLAPLQGEYCNTVLPHLLLAGRRGQVTFWSPFENEGDGNHNVCVVGSSGSGKSVFMQDTAVGLLGAGCRVFVIDNGRSFKNTCTMLSGAWIRFSLDRDICLNPFSIADHDHSDQEDISDTKRSIAKLVELMARGERGATDEEGGLIEMAVNQVFDEQGKEGSIDAVVEILAASEDRRGKDLAMSLVTYTSKGVYGRFFNGPANIEIDNPFTVFEMEDLDSKPELRGVVILLVLGLLRKAMKRGGRTQRKALIIDEAWSLLGDGAAGEYIDGFVRRCRKEGGAIITGTQSLNDYYKTSGAQSCFENSDWLVCLRLKPEIIEQFKKNDRIQADEAMIETLKTLRMEPGVFAEALIKGPNSRFLARLALDAYSATLYSTKPEVLGAVEALTNSGLSTAEAIRRVAFGENSPLQIDQQLKAAVEEMIARDPDFGDLMNVYAHLGEGGRRRVVDLARRLRTPVEGEAA